MSDNVVSLYFLVLALILFVILVFVYKTTVALGRLDRRLEQLARHLRDLNLYDLHSTDAIGVFGIATEVGGRRDSGTDEAASTPAHAEDGTAAERDKTAPPGASDTTPLRKKPRPDGEA